MSKGKPISYPHRATVPPIYQSAVFDFERVEDLVAQIKSGPAFPPSVDDLTYIYARGGNPTQRKLELDLAALELTDDGLTFRFEAADWATLDRLVWRFSYGLPYAGDALWARYEEGQPEQRFEFEGQRVAVSGPLIGKLGWDFYVYDCAILDRP